MSSTIYYFGAVVWIGGVLLFIGNVTGAFPTFPYAGFIVTLIGVGIQSLGNSIIIRKGHGRQRSEE